MKRSTCLALLLVALVAGVAALIVRSQRGPAEKASGDPAKNVSKAKTSEPDSDGGKPAPPVPKVTQLSQEARGHLAEKAFIANLRSLFLQRQSESDGGAPSGQWIAKLSTLSGDDLPPARRDAWVAYLECCRALMDPARASDSQWRQKVQEAASVLNAMLKAHGDGDIQL